MRVSQLLTLAAHCYYLSGSVLFRMVGPIAGRGVKVHFCCARVSVAFRQIQCVDAVPSTCLALLWRGRGV